jgi:signal transduction histidine kinase
VRVGRLIAGTIGVLLALAAAGIGVALVATARVDDARQLLFEQVVPARRSSLQLENAYINQETGVRGYIITGARSFLEPYEMGRTQAAASAARVSAHARAVGAPVARQLAAVLSRAETWRARYAGPAIARSGRAARNQPVTSASSGRGYFDAIRVELAALERTLEHKASQARSRLTSATSTLKALLIGVAVLVIGSLIAAGLVLRRAVTDPLARLGAGAARVMQGDFASPLPRDRGAREVNELAGEIEAMRARIVFELEAVETARVRLEQQALELARSNAELEQFAYVASHDLQEPLRKVASVCQALKTRYGGQLDERADQYIDFAVDGAKRMQSLINDLLEFSRVGHGGRPYAPVTLADAVADAESSLSEQIERTGARLNVGPLPTVIGDRVLLSSLFYNLIGNALKFHGAQPPQISLESVQHDGRWEIICADNGIGIEPDYAERIFLIFQRLHTRDSYEGSGIGLALCRKIVEHHGGEIWLDTSRTPGACFRFTLPSPPEART